MAGNAAPADKLRLDKWLWAARFYKTRALAVEAISGGKVHLNRERVKPSHSVRVGDALQVRRGPYVFDVSVAGLSARRGPASEAATLYEESAESQAARQALADQLRLERSHWGPQKGRPTKRDRRHIVRFIRRQAPENE